MADGNEVLEFLDAGSHNSDADQFVRQHLAAPLLASQRLNARPDTASVIIDHTTTEFDSFSGPFDGYQHSDIESRLDTSPAAVCTGTSYTACEIDAAHTTGSTSVDAAASIVGCPHRQAETTMHLDFAGYLKMKSTSSVSMCTVQMSDDAVYASGYANMAATCSSTMGRPCIWADDMKAACPPIPIKQRLLYHAAAMQPVELSSSSDNMVPRKGRNNIRISKDPQSMAARQRRQRVSEKMQVLQRLVPGGAKLDSAAMLEEAAQYMKFLKAEVEKMEAIEEWMSMRVAGPICTHKFKEMLPLLADDSSADQSLSSITSLPSKGAHHCSSSV